MGQHALVKGVQHLVERKRYWLRLSPKNYLHVPCAVKRISRDKQNLPIKQSLQRELAAIFHKRREDQDSKQMKNALKGAKHAGMHTYRNKSKFVLKARKQN